MTTSEPEPQDILHLFRAVLTIRLFEERIRDLRADGQIAGSVHLSIGQEAIPVGTCAVLQPQDTVFSTYRGHGWAIARGAGLEPMFAELLGRGSGLNGGRGGSAYLSAPEIGFYGENSIVGAGAAVALGPALAAKHDASDRVSVTVFGDGAMNQGAVTESFNFAAAFQLPIVFICENNGYSELTRIVDMVANPALYERLKPLGIPAARIDGNDAQPVADAARAAVDSARSGGGPQFIEAITQRLVGHYIGDAEQYRPKGEVAAASLVEPLVRLHTAAENEHGADTVQRTIDAVIAAIDEACRNALADDLADSSTVLEHLYAAT